MKEIGEDQIRVIGEDSDSKKLFNSKWIVAIIVIVIALLIVIVLLFNNFNKEKVILNELEQAYYEPFSLEQKVVCEDKVLRQSTIEEVQKAYTEILDTMINDVPLKIYIPRGVAYSLHIGPFDKTDTTIIFIAQAADIRADNAGIVGAFVLEGEPLSRGLSKKGYCAIIDDKIPIGVAENSPLFERATEHNGYFFRQYALVDNKQLIENKPKGKYTRRAIGYYNGEVAIFETLTRESYHDFSQALVDLGVETAISLVGGTAYGWAIDKSGNRNEFGEEVDFVNDPLKKNVNYIICRTK